MKLAEREVKLSNGLAVREIRKRSETARQTSILTTNREAPREGLAASMFARWSQENYFRYMRQDFSLDRLVEYGTEEIPEAIQTVNPPWRKLDSAIRSGNGKLTKLRAKFGALVLSPEPAAKEMEKFLHRKGELKEEIQTLEADIAKLKQQCKETAHYVQNS